MPSLSSGQKYELAKVDFSYSCSEFITLEDGTQFSFKDHEYLLEIYQNHHLHTVIEKAGQMGVSTYAILFAFWACSNVLPTGVIYFFPTRTDVHDFSRGRVTPLVQNNEIIRRQVKDTDNVGLKQVGKSFVYFRGMESKIGMKSVPADFLIFDELDEAKPKAKKLAEKRVSHSKYQWELELSNPSIPNFGVDEAFHKSDQRYWHLKCPHCNSWNCLEEEFPHCLLETKRGVIRACKRCRKELDISRGLWVPKHPSKKEIRGYHLSQLFAASVSPASILREFRETQYMEVFYNLTLGLPYADRKNKLEKQEILDLCSHDEMETSSDQLCTMGVDQGNDIHVVISRSSLNAKRQYIYLNVLKEFEELDDLMNQFNVYRCVIDALPEKRKAREFANRFPGRVFLNFYNDHQKGNYKWNEEEYIVQEDRTESLDASQNLLRSEEIMLPREDQHVREFATHCASIAKKLEEDPNTGSKRYKYIRIAADHYRMACNYDCIAWSDEDQVTEEPEDYIEEPATEGAFAL